MTSHTLTISFLAAALLVLSGCGKKEEAPTVSFSNDVKPLLDRYCADCHGEEGVGVDASGFRTDSYEHVMTGTRYGPMVEPGDPLSSSLYRLVSGREVDPSIQMPHGEKKLLQSEIKLIEDWIRQGAKDN
jgi:hypothetical protein